MVSRSWNAQRGFLWAVILLGILLRFVPMLRTDFPINDGGMFLGMIRDLRDNRFAIPEFTSYNQSNIPFAYPPFGFYVVAIISSLFPVSDIDLLRWLPALVSAAIVPVFCWLASNLFQDKNKVLIAAVFVAFMPGSFDWLVMGGGLSRSFGILFFLLALGNVLKLFRDENPRSIWTSILFCALAVLSHPEVGLQTAGICFLLWVVYGRNRTGIRNAILVGLGTALATSAWWLTVLTYHGFVPFQSAIQTGIHETFIASLFHSFFSMQGGLPILPILSTLGLFLTLRKREYLLFGWAFLPFVLDPRNAPAITQYAYILLSSEAVYFLWGKFAQAYVDDTRKRGSTPSPYAPFYLAMPLVALAGYLLWITFTASWNFGRVSLREVDRETMEWIKSNTPEDGRFLLMTNSGQVNPMTDAYQEWFPALTERHSQNTIQGREWTLGGQFYETFLQLTELQTCNTLGCLRMWASNNEIQIEYVLIRVGRVSPGLVASIESDGGFQVVYESDTTLIYKSNP